MIDSWVSIYSKPQNGKCFSTFKLIDSFMDIVDIQSSGECMESCHEWIDGSIFNSTAIHITPYCVYFTSIWNIYNYCSGSEYVLEGK